MNWDKNYALIGDYFLFPNLRKLFDGKRFDFNYLIIAQPINLSIGRGIVLNYIIRFAMNK